MYHLVGRVGNQVDIANIPLFLYLDKAGFITEKNIYIYGGIRKLIIYPDDNGIA